MRVIGFLNSLSSAESSNVVAAFRQGVAQAGFVEGERIRFEYLYADGAYQRLPGMAAELVRPNVAVIAAGAPPAALAAKAATATIPIVFVVGFDPVTAGLVASYNRPGGNATGVCLITSPLSQERLELIFELVPKARIISMLVNPHVSGSAIEVEDAASTNHSGAFAKIELGAIGHLNTSPGRNVGIGHSHQPPVPSVPGGHEKAQSCATISSGRALSSPKRVTNLNVQHAQDLLACDVGALACRPAYRRREAVHQR
jgi:hypothetical protein